MAIELYSWATPNGHKVHILLEELGLEYKVHPIDIGNGDQFDPDFLKISPNNRIPAIVDPDGPGGQPSRALRIRRDPVLSGGEARPLPAGRCGRARYLTMQWLMWQMGGLGPMLGQAHHFLQYAPEKIDYAMKRYANEANRLYGVLDKRLGESRYLAGDDYSIADMAAWPWTRYPERQNVERADYPNFQRWFDEIAERPAVKRGVEVLTSLRREGGFDDKAREVLFGATQFQRR